MSEQDVEMFYKQAMSYLGQGEIDKAIEFFDKALKLDDWYLPAWNDKGVAYLEKKDYNEALNCFEKVVLLDPVSSMPLYNKGYVQLILENYADSIETFDSFLERYQNKDDSDINLSNKNIPVDTLTNLNKNYPKELTNQMRSLVDQMRINKKPDGLAIPRRSTDNFIQTAYEGRIPDYRLPDTTGKIQEIDINIDTIETEITAEKRSGDDINIDTLGEISRKRAEEMEDSINLPGIRYEDDMSAGTAG